jgi:hypothetical protein
MPMYYGSDMKKPCASVPITDTKQAKGLEIGEEVSVTLTGIVKSIEGPREEIMYKEDGSESRMMPGGFEIEIKSLKVGTIESDDKEKE